MSITRHSAEFSEVVNSMKTPIPEGSYSLPPQAAIASALGYSIGSLYYPTGQGSTYAEKLETATGLQVVRTNMILVPKNTEDVAEEQSSSLPMQLYEMTPQQLLRVISRATQLLSNNLNVE